VKKAKPLQAGDEVIALVRTMGGWKGRGRVIEVDHATVTIQKAGTHDECGTAEFCPHEVRRTRTASRRQSPTPATPAPE
jgi:hypothetical protein